MTYRLELCIAQQKKRIMHCYHIKFKRIHIKMFFFLGKKLNIIDNRWVKKMENEMSECNNLFLEK